ALVAARATLMQALPPGGLMLTVGASERDVRALITAVAAAAATEHAEIAAVNGPASTVVSRDPDAVRRLAPRAEPNRLQTTPLRVSHAFHSHHMDPMLDAFRSVVERLAFHPAQIPIVSNLTGRLASDAELDSPGYWVDHVRHPVRFLDGVH